MGVKEIGKRKRTWQKLRTMLYEFTDTWYQQTKVWPNQNLEPKCTKIIKNMILMLRFFILHRIILFNPGMVSEFYLWWCEQVSVRIIYFLQILQCTFNKIHRITSRSAHAFVAKQQSKKTNKHWPQMAMESKTNIQTWNSSILTIIWACTKRSSNCEGRMLFLTRGPYALLRFPQFCLREIPVFGYAYAVLTRSLWIRFCVQTCSGSLRTRLFR